MSNAAPPACSPPALPRRRGALIVIVHAFTADDKVYYLAIDADLAAGKNDR